MRQLRSHAQRELQRRGLRHGSAHGRSKNRRLVGMLGADAGHQIFKRRVNNVGLESPNNFIFARASIAGPTVHGSQQSRKARIGDHYEMLIRIVVVWMEQGQRVETCVWIPTAKDFVERVSLAHKEKRVASSAG